MNNKGRSNFYDSFEDGSDLDITLSYPEQISDRVDLNQTSEKVQAKIKKMTKDFIKMYAESDKSRELGGVLIGSYEEIEGQYHVYIIAAIKANHTDASKAEIKFTHQTWEDINREKEQCYPNDKIVGWFHTHPGFGVFLSDYDLFIQEHFFKLDFQVAYVVDPIKGKDGFFGNDNGEIVKISYEIAETATPVYRSQPAITGYPKKRWIEKVIRKIRLWGALCLVALILSAVAIFNFWDLKSNDEVSPRQITGTSELGSNQQSESSPFKPKPDSYLVDIDVDELKQEYKILRDEYDKLKRQQTEPE